MALNVRSLPGEPPAAPRPMTRRTPRARRAAPASSCRNCGARLNRNALGVLCQPLRKRLQLWVELARAFDSSRRAEHVLELAVELEHVREVIGAGEAKRCVLRWRQRDVSHRLAERTRQLLGHLRTSQMLAGDADRLADQLLAAREDAERARADVGGGDTRHLCFAHRQHEASTPSAPRCGCMPK